MKKTPVVFSIDHNYVMQAGVCILSLLINSTKEEYYDIYILASNDITEDDKDLLRQNIIPYNADIHFIGIDNQFDNTFEIRNISKAAYFRLLIPDLIPQYDKIIYSDVDVIFQNGLKDVLDIPIKNCYVAGIKSMSIGLNNNYLQKLGLNKGEYIYSGFLLINAKLQREKKLFNQIRPHLIKEYKYQDQDIINIVCKGKIQYLPLEYCFTQLAYNYAISKNKILNHFFTNDEIIRAAKLGIVHYEGMNKPWNSYCYRSDLWWYYYRKSIFYNEEFCYQIAKKIQHPTLSFKDVLRTIKKYIKQQYANK